MQSVADIDKQIAERIEAAFKAQNQQIAAIAKDQARIIERTLNAVREQMRHEIAERLRELRADVAIQRAHGNGFVDFADDKVVVDGIPKLWTRQRHAA